MAEPWESDPIEEEAPWAADPVEGENPFIEGVSAFSRGGNTGLARMLGAPTDVVNYGLKQVGLGVEKPFGGSQRIRDWLSEMGRGYGDISQVPEQYRPFARAGEVTGESIPFMAAPLAAVRAGMQGPRMLAPIMEAARTTPGAFAATEAASTGGAALGGAVGGGFGAGRSFDRCGG